MNYKHGYSQKGKVTPEYIVWNGMKHRCCNPNNKSYRNYGGRGIRICKHWLIFENFLEDMGPRPDGLTLERRDNDGNYEPSNCYWVTWSKQANNRRPKSCGPNRQRIFSARNGQCAMVTSNNQHEFARNHGLDHSQISKCLRGIYKQHKGWKFQWI